MRALILFLVATLFFGCASSVSQKVYLALEATPVLKTAEGPVLPFRIIVKDIEPRRLYDNTTVVIRKTDFSVGYARRIEWAIRPAVAFTEMMDNALQSKVACQAIRRRYSESIPSMMAQGTLLKAEEDLRNGKRAVNFSARLQLSRLSDESFILDKEYGSSRALPPEAGYEEFAAVLNALMQEAANQFALDARDALKAEADAKKHSTN